MMSVKKRLPVMILLLMIASAPLFFNRIGYASAADNSAAQSMMLMEAESGRVLSAHNADLRLPMASTTKIVTAIVVIENCDINKKIKVPAAAVGIEGSSIYLQKDEEITVETLLYGLMLQSGNDCAVALALHAGGTVENFAVMMNALARRAGAENSNFKNPHGLHHKEHYTTASDLCRISCYAMKNPTFKKIAGTKQFKADRAGHDHPRVINNKNKILYQYADGNGVKTGFTKAAGRCLVSAAERGGMQLVCAVLNCGPMFQECMRLMSDAFDTYKMTEILSAQNHIGAVQVASGRQPYVRVYTYRPLYYPLKSGEAAAIRCVADVPEKVNAPVKKDQILGSVKIYLDNRLLFTESVCAMDEVRSTTLSDRIGEIIKDIF